MGEPLRHEIHTPPSPSPPPPAQFQLVYGRDEHPRSSSSILILPSPVDASNATRVTFNAQSELTAPSTFSTVATPSTTRIERTFQFADTSAIGIFHSFRFVRHVQARIAIREVAEMSDTVMGRNCLPWGQF